ncbi:G-box-binding factor 4 [Glycine soja]|uniref:G-box-binding factor 4 n=1 Tax=Glycine soja TaxID=3848 RepID=A0A0B2QSW7_GLYSO|nr:G-box-binding factor 4 [Glycine soja]
MMPNSDKSYKPSYLIDDEEENCVESAITRVVMFKNEREGHLMLKSNKRRLETRHGVVEGCLDESGSSTGPFFFIIFVFFYISPFFSSLRSAPHGRPPQVHHPQFRRQGIAAASTDNAGGVTLEDFLTKAIPVTEEDVRGAPPPPPSFLPFPADGSSSSVEPFANNGVGSAPSNSVQKGKRRAVEEPVDKATLQKLRRMIKNRESAARSRERKQAYTSELEYLVHQLEQENARLLKEEAEMRRQRKKHLFECIIPIEVMPKPKKKLRRVNSAQSL